jgi:hypothetical protein
MRLLRSSAFSDTWTTGRPPTSSSSGGCGRERRSLKNGDDMERTALWARKLTWSDDRSIKFVSGMSKDNGADGRSESKAGSSFTRVIVESAYGCSH